MHGASEWTDHRSDRSLHYFRGIVQEVEQLQMTADYWRYLELSLNRMESELREKQAQGETK
jgi:sensor histidine kinase YesM